MIPFDNPLLPAWLYALRGMSRMSKSVTSSGKSKHAGGSKKQKPATRTKARQQKRHQTKATWKAQGRKSR